MRLARVVPLFGSSECFVVCSSPTWLSAARSTLLFATRRPLGMLGPRRTKTATFRRPRSTTRRRRRTISRCVSLQQACLTSLADLFRAFQIFGLEHTHDTKVGDACTAYLSISLYARSSEAHPSCDFASQTFEASQEESGSESVSRRSLRVVRRFSCGTTRREASTPTRRLSIPKSCGSSRTSTATPRPFRSIRPATASMRYLGPLFYPARSSLDVHVQQFDKILVIAEGQTLFYGPRRDAKKYFEELGFECMRKFPFCSWPSS